MALRQVFTIGLGCFSALLIVASAGCLPTYESKLKGNTTQVDPPEPPLDPTPPPKPVWDGGFSQIQCVYTHARQSLFLGVAGMINSAGTQFQAKSAEMVQFAPEGWITVDIGFPDHNADSIPVTRPEIVEVTYYIFFRGADQTYEYKRAVRGEFKSGQGLQVPFSFTGGDLNCQINEPQQ